MTVTLVHPEGVHRVDVHHQAEQFVVGRERAARTLGVGLRQPSTWIGVTSLAAPGYLVEVDAIAVLP
jgi:hypothetical protein